MLSTLMQVMCDVAPDYFRTVTVYAGPFADKSARDYTLNFANLQAGYARSTKWTNAGGGLSEVVGELPALLVYEEHDGRVLIAALGSNDENPDDAARGTRFSLDAKAELRGHLLTTTNALAKDRRVMRANAGPARPSDDNTHQAPAYHVSLDYAVCEGPELPAPPPYRAAPIAGYYS